MRTFVVKFLSFRAAYQRTLSATVFPGDLSDAIAFLISQGNVILSVTWY